MDHALPRILVVDDEEAILETMTYTFQDEYEVFVSKSARRGLEILDEHGPFAVVLTDQRMPDMSGVEFVAEIFKRHPSTVRMILTGFSDMDAIIQAINDGHVYAYITKPWEPDQLKQLMKQAVAHHRLRLENDRLLADLQRVNHFIQVVMDEFDTGAIAVDANGIIQAVNRPACDYLGLGDDVRGRPLDDVLKAEGLDAIAYAASVVAGDEEVNHYDVEVENHQFRVTSRQLADTSGTSLGNVILLREVSHEPLQQRFRDLIGSIADTEGTIRGELERVRDQLPELAEEVRVSKIESPGIRVLKERISRTLTAIENWLDVDDAMANEDFPDAQVLLDRMRVGLARWPLAGDPPKRVRKLARRAEEYYESGEKPKQSVL